MGLKLMICVAFIAFVAVDAGQVPVCEQPQVVGPCRASIPRYYYNSTSDRCEKFIYGGCRGNDNNFETCVECSVTCSKTADIWCPIAPLPIDACNEPKKVGPCRAAYRRFFYNKANGRCEKFIWGGCAPNGNNFETCEECTVRCSNDISLPCLPLQVPIVTPAPPVEVCDQPKKVGPCTAAFPRYYYNKASGRCEKFTWGGCAPNANNFETCGECSVTCAKDISLPCLPEAPTVDPSPPVPPVDVCDQPKKVGPCKAAVPRYYYNKANGRCEKFTWGGCAPNENNFETCGECSVTCVKDISLPCLPEAPVNPSPPLPPVDVCEQPKYVGNCTAAFRQYYYNSETGKCEEFIYGGCGANDNNFDTCLECNTRCSRDVSQPCLPLPGLPTTPAPSRDVCELPKDPGSCFGAFHRYFYNSASGRCESFIYGGCPGNGNNFDTCVECNSRCSNDINQPCKEEPEFPYDPVDACDQPKKPGPCKLGLQRFYYNSVSGRCEVFIYGGCQANYNNFGTCLECSERCVKDNILQCLSEPPIVIPSPPVPPVDVCEQPKYVGNCAAAFPQFYYNSATGRCEQFIYGGCGANDNNFDTCLECNTRCSRDVSQPCLPLPGVPPTPAPSREVCVLPKDPGPCLAAFERYFYNSASGRCERFIYGGCMGNGSNFATCVECNSRCSNDNIQPCKEEPEFPFSPVDACDQPMKPGPCKLGLKRFYYNSASGKCEEFIYGGCQANYNNFGTCSECSERCENKMVPA